MQENRSEYFLDTNIWLYAFLEPEKNKRKSEIASSLIDASGVVISTQVINEVCVNLIKKAAFDSARIKQLVQDFYLGCRVIEFNRQILLSAAELRQNYNFSFWDSLIVACAKEAGVSLLYSEDMQDQMVVSERLRIVNPFVEENSLPPS